MAESRKTTHELQLHVEELKKRLKTLESLEAGAGRGRDAGGQRKAAADRKWNKERTVRTLHTVVASEKKRLSTEAVRVNFPKLESSSLHSFELTSEYITWSDVCYQACIMFGHRLEDVMILELRNGQRVMVPDWKQLKPGSEIDAEIVERPPAVSISAKPKRLRSRSSHTNVPTKDHSSSLEYGDKAIHSSSAHEDSYASDAVSTDETDTYRKLNKAMSREILFDFILHIIVFVLLALGLQDPLSDQGTLRHFSKSLAGVGYLPYNFNRSGSETILAFDVNVTSMNEAWSFVKGPLTNFLVSNITSNNDIIPRQSESWWGNMSPDTCLPHDPLASKSLPLCQVAFSGNSTRKRWVTQTADTEVLGSVRLRQLRVRQTPCEYDVDKKAVLPVCYENYNDHTRSTVIYGVGGCGFEWHSGKELTEGKYGAPAVSGILANYDSGGYVVDVPSAELWMDTLLYLEGNNWIDIATRAIFIEFSIRAPNTDLFASVRAMIERDMIGVAWPHFEVKAVRISQSSCVTCSLRFITDIVVFVLILINFTRIITGGFFYRPKQRIWRTYDFIFFLLFIGSFAVDMYMFSELPVQQETFVPANEGYLSLDSVYSLVRLANRYRSVIISLIAIRFLFQGSFGFSRVINLVLIRLFFVYVYLLILLLPFICALTILSMVLQQGSPYQLVSFGYALKDIFLVVIGANDKLSSITEVGGPQGGWNTVFYLFLITFTWVLIVPTLIACALITYELQCDIRGTHIEDDNDVHNMDTSTISHDSRSVGKMDTSLKKLLRVQSTAGGYMEGSIHEKTAATLTILVIRDVINSVSKSISAIFKKPFSRTGAENGRQRD